MRSVLIFAGLALMASSAGAVSFVNGSFEQSINPGKSKLLLAGDLTSIPGWKVLGTNIDLVGTAWQAADGGRSLDLSGNAPGGIEQTLHGLTVGALYEITFDLSGSYVGTRTSPNMMSVSASGNVRQTFSYDLDNTNSNMMYQSTAYLFTPTNAISVIQFRGLDRGSYGAVLDNVGVQLAPTSISAVGGVPEPAMWAMMLGGFALTGTAMRRRTSSVAA